MFYEAFTKMSNVYAVHFEKHFDCITFSVSFTFTEVHYSVFTYAFS